MQLLLISCGLLAFLAAHVSATALTYKMQPHEKACFFTATKNKGEKIAFYFAVWFPTPIPGSVGCILTIACAGAIRRRI